MTVPSNLVPTPISQLPTVPNTPSTADQLMVVQNGVTYRATLGSLVNVVTVPSNRRVDTGTGLAGGGPLTSNLTLYLANSGVTAGTYGSGGAVPIISVNAQGQLTNVSTAAISVAFNDITGKPTTLAGYGITDAQPLNSNLTALAGVGTAGLLTLTASGSATSRTITAGTGITITNGSGVSGNPTVTLSNTAVTAGEYGSATTIPTFIVNQQGQITSIGVNDVEVEWSNVHNTPTTLAGYGITDAVPNTRTVTGIYSLTGGGALSSNLQLSLVNDQNSPGNGKYYGTDNLGQRGWYTLSGGGSVTSVGLNMPSDFAVAGSPITSSGTFSVSYANQASHKFFAGPTSGVDATPTFRTIVAGDLPVTGVSAGSYGSATQTGTFTVDDQGRLTSASNVTIAPAFSSITGKPTTLAGYGITDGALNTTTISAGTGLTGGGNLTTSRTLSIANTTVTSAAYGSQSSVATFTVNAQGQLTAAASVPINAVALTTGTISTAPANATDIANKNYVDSVAAGLNFHQACNYATTTALPSYVYNNGAGGIGATITAVANGALSIDGATPSVNQRILVKNETAGNEPYNGIYTVTVAGSAISAFVLTRATDYDSSGTGTNEIDQGDFVLVLSGTTNANTSWVQQTPLPITVGTTALVFIQFGGGTAYTAGTGLSLVGTQFSIANTTVSAGSYGGAATVPTYTVNAQGQLTAASNTSIAIAGSQITSGSVAPTVGGTGVTSYATGDLLYASATNTLSKLSATTNGYLLTLAGGVPTWAAPPATGVTSITFGTTGLTPNTATTGAVTVAGTLVAANGGTGQSSYTVGDLLYASGVTTLSKLAAVAPGSVLVSNGVGVAPSYSDGPTVATLTAGEVYGGTNATSRLILQSTTGVGTSDIISMKVGNNGSIEAVRIATTGIVSLPTTGAIVLPASTTANRPTGQTGMLRFNTTTTAFEGYNGTAWGSIGGGATGGGTDQIFYLNGQTVTTNYSIPSGQNAGTFGPITINAGATVTVPSGSTWSII